MDPRWERRLLGVEGLFLVYRRRGWVGWFREHCQVELIDTAAAHLLISFYLVMGWGSRTWQADTDSASQARQCGASEDIYLNNSDKSYSLSSPQNFMCYSLCVRLEDSLLLWVAYYKGNSTQPGFLCISWFDKTKTPVGNHTGGDKGSLLSQAYFLSASPTQCMQIQVSCCGERK